MRGLTVAAAAIVAAAGVATAKPSCVDGLYMIVARGTGEDEGTGISGELADKVADHIGHSKVIGLDYPATLEDPDYGDSETDGAVAMKKAVTEYHDACPDSKIALMGYSQGAQLTSDAICGGTSGFNNITALPTDLVESSIVAIVLFGDPSHIANTTYDKGTSVNDGIFPREDISLCKKYSDRIVSYCNEGDIYCDSGNNMTVHALYTYYDGDEAVDYILDKYDKAVSSDSGSSSTRMATTTGTTTTATATATGSTETASTTKGTSTTTATPSTSATTKLTASNTDSSSKPSDTSGAGATKGPGQSLLVTAPLLAAGLLYHLF